jgi:hypothetical protein
MKKTQLERLGLAQRSVEELIRYLATTRSQDKPFTKKRLIKFCLAAGAEQDLGYPAYRYLENYILEKYSTGD